MSRKDEIKRLWAEAFGDPREYIQMYFDRVYREADALTLADDEGHIVSSLLLQPYAMTFLGSPATASYIAGAATRRSMRGRGLMSALMTDALEASHARGDIITCLIPASRYLYGYYALFGFATVAFADVKRYTSLHAFAPAEGEETEEFTPVDDLFVPAVYEAMEAMELASPRSTILHSHRDYLNILDDLRLDGGICAAVADSSGAVAAMAFARPAPDGSGAVRVDEVLSLSPAAAQAAMRRLRAYWPGRPFMVLDPPADDGRRLTPRGMARIVNAETILGLAAAADPALRSTVRITDPLIASNNATFRLASGHAERLDPTATPKRLDLDIRIDTLADILFSSPAMGAVMGLPSARLRMALMLD